MTINRMNFLKVVGLFIAFLGIFVIIGWYLDVTALKTLLSEYESMKANTAISFVLAGSAFYLLVIDKWRNISGVLCVLVIAISFASLAQSVFKYDLGIDQLLIVDREAGDLYPGRPAPTTSICFILIGLAFLSIKSSVKGRLFSQYALNVVTLISFIVMVGYIYMIPSLHKFTFVTSVALHTGLAFFILSTSATLMNAEMGITGLFTGKKTGNIISRRLFPQLIIVFLILGYIRIIAHRTNLVSVEFGIALHVISSIVIVLFLVWYNAYKINGIDDQRKEGENEILRINQNLEATVGELTKIRQKLDLKVHELENTNNELKTFNYISSHDLQEPLRKIRNFSEVLLEEEGKNLSRSGKHYLERMSQTSSKMQRLLEDLLLYSRVKNSAQNFVKTDLSQILQSVITELHDAISEKAMTIRSEGCSVAMIIPFQFRQLLINLISNALKFVDPERKPQVWVNFETGSGQRFGPKLLPGTEYCHMTFSDNGIGFDPKYNERIFEVFERLHGSDRYEGTGMGLAICKRIVENHHGLITASGELNRGAKFDIYFPVEINRMATKIPDHH